MTPEEIIKPYLTKHGLVGHKRRGYVPHTYYQVPAAETNSGNGIMYTCEVLWCLGKERRLKYPALELTDAINRCHRQQGQFLRTPEGEYGHQSFDDLFAISSWNSFYAQMILSHLRRHWGFYPTTPNPNKKWSKSWWKFWGQIFLARRQDFVCHLRFAAGERVWNPIQLLHWWYTMKSVPKTIDGYRIKYFMAKVASPRWWVLYLDQVQAKYGSVAKMRAGYFQDDHHPSSRLCNE